MIISGLSETRGNVNALHSTQDVRNLKLWSWIWAESETRFIQIGAVPLLSWFSLSPGGLQVLDHLLQPRERDVDGAGGRGGGAPGGSGLCHRGPARLLTFQQMTTNVPPGGGGGGAQSMGGGSISQNIILWQARRSDDGGVYKLFFYRFDQSTFVIPLWGFRKKRCNSRIETLLCSETRSAPCLICFKLIVSVFWLLFDSTHSVELNSSFHIHRILYWVEASSQWNHSVDWRWEKQPLTA